METKNPIFDLNVPEETAMRMLKIRTPYREGENKCGHKAGVVTVYGGYCVLDYYCNLCGAWRGDKDVS